MKYVIDESVVEKSKLTLPEVFAMLLVKTGANVKETFSDLLKKEGVVLSPTEGKYLATQRWSDMCDNILLSSEKTIPTDEELLPLVEKLMSIFPQGRKPGTSYYYKCNQKEVSSKLKIFYKIYGVKYTEEEIVEAARRYVDSFNGDYTFMRILKYFIWKKDKEQGETSELATFLENAGQEDEDTTDNSWVNELK